MSDTPPRDPMQDLDKQHVREDLGFIPSFADWMIAIRPEPRMDRALRLERELETVDAPASLSASRCIEI